MNFPPASFRQVRTGSRLGRIAHRGCRTWRSPARPNARAARRAKQQGDPAVPFIELGQVADKGVLRLLPPTP